MHFYTNTEANCILLPPRTAQSERNLIGCHAIVRAQGSFRLSGFTEPQPDLILLKPTADFYWSRFATGDDTLLVIEVSDRSDRAARPRRESRRPEQAADALTGDGAGSHARLVLAARRERRGRQSAITPAALAAMHPPLALPVPR